MKEQIKKFYKEHKSEVHVAIVSSVLTAFIAKRQFGGLEVVGVHLWTADDGAQSITVQQKNGLMQTFDRPARPV